ncbi:cytochrome P450 [Laetiporus sulphureus 93-53]|uniref:Cytochrome P450 n=1 Tax=Laetiporus sulphureus 93-53 TaxID=1314785 RepID=A0A165BLT3_9APHY|nr:cytochrome P450 [Laetiporus sulphureus 93-53]KZT01283.1 cytochrome P450 [Laetiporus sulphureus 93-53]
MSYVGNFMKFFDWKGWDFQREIGEKYGSVVKLNGPLGKKLLFVFDPLALSSVVVKDQYIYEETPETMHLLLGERHRKQRRLLTSVSSTANTWHTVPVLFKITDKGHAIALHIKERVQEINIIGQAGLGYSFDPLTSDSADDFSDAINSIICALPIPIFLSARLSERDSRPTLAPLRIVHPLLPFVMKIGRPAFRRCLVKMFPHRYLRRAGEISDTISKYSRRIHEGKTAALEGGDEAVIRQIGEGKEIISKPSNVSASEEEKLPENELSGRMSTSIFAGMDTTSNALARILDMLAKHPEVQHMEIQKARRENDEIPYDMLEELPHLDAVCPETIETSKPIRASDGTMMNEIPVSTGTAVCISILACNRNPEIWSPDAAEWKPDHERWLKQLPKVMNAQVGPDLLWCRMTSIGGGRALHLSELEMKHSRLVLAVLLSSFTFGSTGKDIYWNIVAIQYPTVEQNSKPQMHTKVGSATAL